ncbi:pentatricopeptide repeat-containing protein At1g09900-like [Phalaenopsis equestris]|uniref:pentatricopeptide repeat-containing protein At1g09900-like n=1 Tax=Phalaenopsis equestris TaxID=78828 RepID=UPI0009E5150B|nr:pentatricopeptide repeat-containing protein At1g09900-like [Phalaenopsis equestris]XP_020584091.1 pentatricopeptide repeat-containing protein At1g09900-like [Phalaenopsis equestris]XP_020584092.1 pentatricopeptide repeat-containing protein At1g09900-like [Phalaenopsis equestris]
MDPKKGNAGTLLLRCRYMLSPRNSNPKCVNPMSLCPTPHLNVKPSSPNGSPILAHNLTLSASSYFHFTRTGFLFRRLLPINLPANVRSSSQSFYRMPGRQHYVVRFSSMARYDRRSSMTCNIGLGPEKLAVIVEEISRNAEDMEPKLDKLKLMFSSATVTEVLSVLNDRGVSAARFFDWVVNSNPGFKPDSEIYNLIVNNLGRSEDYTSMIDVLSKLSDKGYCLTEKAFTFLEFCSSSSMKDSVKRVTEVLSSIRGSCRSSGIHSLIKLLCAMNCFQFASFVMEETIRKTSHYNLLIAARCRNGEFSEVMNTFDEMRRHGCDPNTKSYNYLLGSLFKNGRVIEACELLQLMEDGGHVPDLVSYEVVASHACKAKRLDFAMEFLNQMLSEGLKPRPTTHAAFIKGLFWSGRVEDAYNYVTEMSVKDKCSSNCNYSLLADLFRLSGRAIEAAGVLHEMMGKRLKPNFPVYIKALKELHKIGRGDLASELKSMFLKFTMDAG